jgi:tetratricopeptide (TPR) repeat protein
MRARAITWLALACLAAPASAAPSPSPGPGPGPWDDLAQPNRRRCAQLLEAATKLPSRSVMALQMLRGAADLCPNDREVLQTVGEVLLDAHAYAEARRRLERAHQLADEPPPPTRERERSLMFHLGFAREVMGDLDGAIEQHRRVEALGGLPAPDQYLVHYDLGDELMAAGRLSDAIDEYRRAVALAPDKPVVRLALAVALDRDQEVDKSRAELAIVLTLDRTLKRLGGEEYVFVPAADVHYYRALALLERGAAAEARGELRAFVAELPSGPYAAHALERLAEIAERVDPRELEISSAAIDRPALARALGPLLPSLEECLPDRLFRLRLTVGSVGLRAESDHPAAECLDRALARAEIAMPRGGFGVVTVPIAGRRSAPSVR